jgi:hypothetical protein
MSHVLEYEEDFSMTNVGCDIGKNNLDVFIEGKHSKFENNIDGIWEFILRIKEVDSPRIVLEPPGGYESPLLRRLLSENTRTKGCVSSGTRGSNPSSRQFSGDAKVRKTAAGEESVGNHLHEYSESH